MPRRRSAARLGLCRSKHRRDAATEAASRPVIKIGIQIAIAHREGSHETMLADSGEPMRVKSIAFGFPKNS